MTLFFVVFFMLKCNFCLVAFIFQECVKLSNDIPLKNGEER